MSDEYDDIRWGLAQRFEFIEWRVYWVGRVNRKDLEDQFHISTPQASSDFKRYLDTVPENIAYDASQKSYVATSGFRPRFLKLSPERYLLQLQAIRSDAIRKADTWFDHLPSSDAIPMIVRGPEAFTLRALIRAIEFGGSIEINYRSLSRVDVRTVCPHAFAHDGFRWHVRALSIERQDYRDYVLGRILSVSEPKSSDARANDDIEWQTEVSLKLIPHPNLNDDQKLAIEHDYRLKDGHLILKMRAALVFYFIRRHNLDLRKGEIPPERAQLYLENYEEVGERVDEAKRQTKEILTNKL